MYTDYDKLFQQVDRIWGPVLSGNSRQRRKARRKWAREFKVALRDPGLPTLKFPLHICLDEVVIHGRDDAKTK